MAIPAIPTNFFVQQGNSQVLLSWNLSAGATAYPVYRSTDAVNFTLLSTPATNSYLDTAVTVGTTYYYQVASQNGSGTSSFTSYQSAVPTIQGQMSLGQIRLAAQQRADRVNSQFVTTPEWNSYINQSAFELYDILVTVYEDYYLADPFIITVNGTSNQYDLPSDFYKLMGVDYALSSSPNGLVTLNKFDFIQRNNYIYPQLTSNLLGIFNPQYRLMGNKLKFIPTPSGGTQIKVWYIPRMNQLLADNDILDGVSGWTEYVIVDAAIKALQKEESDTQVLMMQKQALLDRIQSSSMNRDAGQPDTISNTRTWPWGYGGNGNGFNGGFGGY